MVQEKNKALVLDAFDTLFNKRDYSAEEKFWSKDYIQHSAHILPGRKGFFDVVKNSPSTLKYENQFDLGEWGFPDAARSILGAWSGPAKLDHCGHRAG